ESAGTFHFSPAKEREGGEVAWVNYRHWVRQGGAHLTKVELAQWPEALDRPVPGFGPLTLDEAAGTLSCQGAMPLALRDELLAERLGPGFSNTIERLFEASHIAPITDVYGYDRGREPPGAYEVRDLMFSADVLLPDEQGQFIVAMTDGNEE